MKFDDFDKKMRVYEESLDQVIPPEVYIVARLDGRSFTRLTKQTLDLKKPFDIRFRDAMVQTVERLMNADFRVVYGYTQSDEISLLFHLEADTFSRKVRKLNSLLAAEASVAFSTIMGVNACFDCRVIPLPNWGLVEDYFLWRQEDAHRNSLNSYCYWELRKDGLSPTEANRQIKGISNGEKNELLFRHGINYNDLPSWQKRGTGVYFVDVPIEGRNPITDEVRQSIRHRLFVNYELPIGDDYRGMLLEVMG